MQLLQNYYKMDKDKKVISFMIVIMFIFFVYRTIIADQVGTLNFQYIELKNQIRLIKIKNADLYEQILYEKSLGRIEAKAHDLGLTEEATYYILK